MNESYNTSDLQRDFDRLVDGELTAEQQRELLSALDDTPDGWRRCALAFLEAQAWRNEMCRADETPTAAVATPALEAAGRWQRIVPTLMAMAASFLLAFLLGLAFRASSPVQPQVAAGRQSSIETDSSPAVATAPSTANRQPPMAALVRSATPVETIWLPASVDDEESNGELPADLARDLARLGHEIERRVELWPVEFEDGRRAVLPVDRFDVRYVGYEYQ